ncbi:OmpW family outer membrane protein [Luteibacter sp. 329MFSha]|uniref:OmpW/AlkL family protein n=1 Tax=Luteibacter sp. 329MFSha TaxID=1798239 RepID=UPI0008B4CFF9|nr:OmpW family outer membrane protein [Luteibacter sp. 329MFSha]SEV93738.1 outer membrane protein [Luteibacter sp. 329MFSha]
MRHLTFLAAGIACAAAPTAFAATVDSPWIVHVGAHVVDPTSHTGRLAGMHASVDSSTRPTFSIEYRWSDAWSVEALAALPFRHDVSLAGSRAVRVKQLPPVVGVKYRFLPHAAVTPFVGAGVNYTHFFDARGRGPLQGANVDLGDSWGLAWHAGVDIVLAPRWIATVDVRYIDIDSRVKAGGARVGTAHIDPWVYGASVGYRF